MEKLVIVGIVAAFLLIPLSSAATFEELCSASGVFSCVGYDQVTDLTDTIDPAAGGPNRPETNGKCHWNGGGDDCYPVFDGTCAELDASPLTRSQDTYESASLWSACVDESESAARLTFWNDLGAVVQTVNGDSFSAQDMTNLYTQFEVKLSPEFFHDPTGLGFSSLFGINRVRTSSCNEDESFINHQLKKISSQEIQISYTMKCTPKHGTGFSNVRLSLNPSDHANKWIRVHSHFDFVNDVVEMKAYDVGTGDEIFSGVTDSTNGVTLIDDPQIVGTKITMYANKKTPDLSKPSPHLWIRNTILSTQPIGQGDSSPSPDPQPDPDPTPDPNPQPDPQPGQCTKVHEADAVCGVDGDPNCGISEKELRQYARKVLKRQKSLLDLVNAVQIFLNLQTYCPGTHGDTPEPRCGDGTRNIGEQCDDGNTVNGDGCSSVCETESAPDPVCGDGTRDAGEQCDDGNTNSGDGCSSTCQSESVAPPELPELVPGPTDSDAHFAAECAKPGVLGCRDYDSVEDVVEGQEAGIGNTPNTHGRKSKCLYSTCSKCPLPENELSFCAPPFSEGNCALKDQYLADPGRSQETELQASLWSPCYDSQADAARLTFWGDLGSAQPVHTAYRRDKSDQETFTDVWLQFEISMSREFFFSPVGTTSAKLGRFGRAKTDSCLDDRFADMRLGKIKPDRITFLPVGYCNSGSAGSYAGSTSGFDITPDRAGHWIRITAHFDPVDDSVSFWGYDVTDDVMISSKIVSEGLEFPDDIGNIRGYSFTMHSTSHQGHPDQPSPHLWVRHVVISKDPISP